MMDDKQFRRFMLGAYTLGAQTIVRTNKYGYSRDDRLVIEWRRAGTGFGALYMDPRESAKLYGIRELAESGRHVQYEFVQGYAPPFFPKRILFRGMTYKTVEEMVDLILCSHLEKQLSKGDYDEDI
jgi:hypothetical protein